MRKCNVEIFISLRSNVSLAHYHNPNNEGIGWITADSYVNDTLAYNRKVVDKYADGACYGYYLITRQQ